MNRFICLALLSITCTLHWVSAEIRNFTSADGTVIRAEILSVNRLEQVTLEREDGRIFRDVPIEMFSDADRKFIRDWKADEQHRFDNADLTPDSDFVVTVGKRRDDKFNNYGDIDNRVVRFQPRVSIHNDEIKETFTGVNGTLILVGRDVLRKEKHAVIFREDFTLDLPPGEDTDWYGKPFGITNDPDYGGQDYRGYLIVLKNKKGEIVFLKGSVSSWEKNMETLMKASFSTAYDRSFSKNLGRAIVWSD